jgi:hypothetical protein
MTDDISTMQPVTSDPARPATPALSQTQRVMYTFTAPSKTFTDILRSTNWLLPFILSVVVSLAFCFAVQKQVTWPTVFDNISRLNPKSEQRFANMPPAQAAQTRKISATVTAGFSYGTPVIILLISAISAAVLLATLNFGFGGKATYGQIFAVWMFAKLPLTVKYILAIIPLFAGLNTQSFIIQNPVGTNPGYYFPPPDAPLWLNGLLSWFDIFSIWSLILLVIGCAIVAKISKGTAAVAVVGWWVVLMLVSVGWTAATAS